MLRVKLDDENLELRNVVTDYEGEEVEEDSVSVVSPARHNEWEDFHTTTARNQPHTCLARQIAQELGLSPHPDHWELFDQEGRQATLNVASGDSWVTGHRLFYCRRDLLLQYLQKNSKALLIIPDAERFDLPLEDNKRTELARCWVIKP